MKTVTINGGGSPITNLNVGIVFLGKESDYDNDAGSLVAALTGLFSSTGSTTATGAINQYIRGGTTTAIQSAVSLTTFGSAGYLGLPTNGVFTRSSPPGPATSNDLFNIAGPLIAQSSSFIAQGTASINALAMVLPKGATLTDSDILTGHSNIVGNHGRFDYSKTQFGTNTVSGRVYFCASPWISKSLTRIGSMKPIH